MSFQTFFTCYEGLLRKIIHGFDDRFFFDFFRRIDSLRISRTKLNGWFNLPFYYQMLESWIVLFIVDIFFFLLQLQILIENSRLNDPRKHTINFCLLNTIPFFNQIQRSVFHLTQHVCRPTPFQPELTPSCFITVSKSLPFSIFPTFHR